MRQEKFWPAVPLPNRFPQNELSVGRLARHGAANIQQY